MSSGSGPIVRFDPLDYPLIAGARTDSEVQWAPPAPKCSISAARRSLSVPAVGKTEQVERVGIPHDGGLSLHQPSDRHDGLMLRARLDYVRRPLLD